MSMFTVPAVWFSHPDCAALTQQGRMCCFSISRNHLRKISVSYSWKAAEKLTKVTHSLPRGVNLAVLGLCASLRHLSWESPGARQKRGRLKVDVPLLFPRPDVMDSSTFPMPFCSHPGLASAFHCFGSVSASVASAFPSQNRSLSHFITRQQESSA